MFIHDSSYVGENAWDDVPEPSKENVKRVIYSHARLNAEEKEELRKELGFSGEVPDSMGTWRDRLQAWKEILKKEKLSEQLIPKTEELAINALKDNRHILDMIAKEVLEKSRITGLEGPLPHNDHLPLDIYPAPLHRC
ncbi:hypothetical protein V6N13_031755 [Hibiscus sabdariffa]|uniref:Uncharacterized protein n=2 Tax=Hibiscus sabdariffa TaxID=183260 RepID=A0ABR1ZFP5_9ROSI